MDLLDLMNDGMAYAPPSKNELLFRAASKGDIKSFEKHLLGGGDVFHLTNGFNCMHIAVKRNRVDIVKYILEKFPSSVTTLTADGRSCAMLACFEGLVDMIALLQTEREKSSEDANSSEVIILPITSTVDKSGNTALHYACWGGHGECVEFLVRGLGCDLLATNTEGMDALQFASAGNHVDCMKKILLLQSESVPAAPGAEGLVVGGRSSSVSGMGPVHRAAMHGSVEVLQLLLAHFREAQRPDSHGSEVGLFEKAENGNSPLHIAAHRGMSAMVDALLREASEHLEESRRESFINMTNNFGLTAVHFACIGGHSDIFNALTAGGCSSFSHTSTGATPLHLAAGAGSHELSMDIVERLATRAALEEEGPANKGAVWKESLEAMDNDDKTAIDMALDSGYKQLASRLARSNLIAARTESLLNLLA